MHGFNTCTIRRFKHGLLIHEKRCVQRNDRAMFDLRVHLHILKANILLPYLDVVFSNSPPERDVSSRSVSLKDQSHRATAKFDFKATSVFKEIQTNVCK